MDKYYYLISQLPALFFDREMPITLDRFLEEAEKWLSGKDFRTLHRIKWKTERDPEKGPKLWRHYQVFEQRFQHELAQWRQYRKEGQEYRSQLFPPTLVREGNPLEIEKKLLYFRWQVLDELERDHHFDLSSCISYYIKLQMLNRLSIFNRDKGMEKFRQVTAFHQKTPMEDDTEQNKNQVPQGTGNINQ